MGTDPSRDPRLQRRGPGFGEYRMRELESQYQVRYERGEGMIIDRPERPPECRPRIPPAETTSIEVDSFVCADHQLEQGFFIWDKARDHWACYSNGDLVAFPADKIIRVKAATSSGRFLYLCAEEPSAGDFMVRLRDTTQTTVYTFRSVIDRRHNPTRRTDVSEEEMDRLLQKLQKAFESYQATKQHDRTGDSRDAEMAEQPQKLGNTSEHEEVTRPHDAAGELENAKVACMIPDFEKTPQSCGATKPHDPVNKPEDRMDVDPPINEGGTLYQSNFSTLPFTEANPSQQSNTPFFQKLISPDPPTSTSPLPSPQTPALQQLSLTSSRSPLPTPSEPEGEVEVMEPINKGDLVIRLRQKNKYDDPTIRLDSYDIWDGPWRVEKFAGDDTSTKGQPSDDGSNKRTRSSQPLKQPDNAKLRFPDTSRARAWVAVRDLRRAFEIPPGSPSFEDLSNAGERKLYADAVSTSKNRDRRSNPDSAYIAKIANGSFVTFTHVSAKGTDDDEYEVGHLRAKRVMLRDSKKFADEKMEDSEVQQWLKETKKLKKGKVAVVEYLVHWAGWASEDDTWERAQDNLPSDVIKDFEAAREQPTIFPSGKK